MYGMFVYMRIIIMHMYYSGWCKVSFMHEKVHVHVHANHYKVMQWGDTEKMNKQTHTHTHTTCGRWTQSTAYVREGATTDSKQSYREVTPFLLYLSYFYTERNNNNFTKLFASCGFMCSPHEPEEDCAIRATTGEEFLVHWMPRDSCRTHSTSK